MSANINQQKEIVNHDDLKKEIELLVSRFENLHINGNGKKLNGDSKRLLKRIKKIKSLQQKMGI